MQMQVESSMHALSPLIIFVSHCGSPKIHPPIINMQNIGKQPDKAERNKQYTQVNCNKAYDFARILSALFFKGPTAVQNIAVQNAGAIADNF